MYKYTGNNVYSGDECTFSISDDSEGNNDKVVKNLLHHMKKESNDGCKFHTVTYYYCLYIYGSEENNKKS